MCASGEALQIRILSGVKQSAIADVVGISQASISNWERNVSSPAGDDAITYGRVLNQLKAGLDREIALAIAAANSGKANRLRLACSVTTHDIAQEVGVSADVVSQWERAQRKPEGAEAVRYPRVLGRLEAEDVQRRKRQNTVPRIAVVGPFE